MIRVVFVCHGNICRSTLVQCVFADKVKSLGLLKEFFIDSMATSTEELGSPPHRGTVRKLTEMGVPVIPHRAKQISWQDYKDFDYIIGMDTYNIKNLHRMLKGDPDGKVYKLLSFTHLNRDIADPWYTGNFDATYDDAVIGIEGFLDFLRKNGSI